MFSKVSELLQFAYERKKQTHKNITYAQLAQKSGLKSRAHFREIILGQRRLTDKNKSAFQKILELTPSEFKLLEFLIKAEQGSSEDLDKALKFQNRIKNKRQKKTVTLNPSLRVHQQTIHVYAAIPEKAYAQTLAQIVQSTGLSDVVCFQELQRMIQLGWVQENKGLYYCGNEHIAIQELSNPVFLKKWYLSEIRAAEKKASLSFEEKQNLFLTLKFSLNESQRVQLNHDLKNYVSQWIDKNASREGGSIATVTISLI